MIGPSSRPWPFNSIPEPTPADWGIGMTVCIASFCSTLREKTIIGITDSMLSTVDMSADNVAIKFFAFGNKWCAMYAGNDISPVTPIKKFVRDRFRPTTVGETLPDAIGAFREAFRLQLSDRIESQILAPFGMNMPQFLSVGLAQFGPEIFSRLVYEIENVKLDLSFLVLGFDGDTPHIFVVKDQGDVSHYDTPGFWAIGSGQTSALGSLFSRQSSISLIHGPMYEVLYALCKAKFNAETALGVGRNATAFVLEADGSRYLINTPYIEKVKEIWEKVRPPDISQEAKIEVPKIIKEAKRNSKRSLSAFTRKKMKTSKGKTNGNKADAKSAGEGGGK